MLHQHIDTFEFDIRAAISAKMMSSGCSYREAVLELNEILKRLANEVQISEKAVDAYLMKRGDVN